MKLLQLLSSIFPTLVDLRSVSHVHLSAWVFKQHKIGFRVHSYFILLRYCPADGLPVIHNTKQAKPVEHGLSWKESCFHWKRFLLHCWPNTLIRSITSFPVKWLWNMVVVFLQTEERWWNLFEDSYLRFCITTVERKVEITSVKCWVLWCSGLFRSP